MGILLMGRALTVDTGTISQSKSSSSGMKRGGGM